MRRKRRQRIPSNTVVRHWAAPFVLVMLVLRSLVPAGFMLAPVNGGLAVVLCDAGATAAMYGHVGHDMPMSDMAGHDMSGPGHDMAAANDMAGAGMPAAAATNDMAMSNMAGSAGMPAVNDMAGHDMSGHPAGHTHPDPTCPFAQSAGATPLPFLAAISPAIAPSAPVLPDLVAQTYAHFGPTRQQFPRGPPRLA